MFWQKQSQCLNQRAISKDECVFQTFIAGTRVYSCCPDQDELARFILSGKEGATYCNEVLFSDTYGYCDLDSKQTLEQLGFSEEAFIELFNGVLIECHKKHLGITLHPREILWTCSSRPGKTSYHLKIHCPYYWPYASRKTSMKDFFSLVNNVCCATEGLHFYEEKDGKLTLCSVLDLAVYTPNRCFRVCGCSKPDSEVKLIPVGGRITHSSIVQNLLTAPSGLTAFQLKTKPIKQSKVSLEKATLETFAKKFGAEFCHMKGCVAVLRNVGKRVCPIGGEENLTDNCFFVLKDRGSSLHFGCHNQNCHGKLLKVHEIAQNQKYTHYDDYSMLLKTDTKYEDIVEYMISTIKFIDRPCDPYFVTTSLSGVSCFDNKVKVIVANCSKSLFKNYSDIKLTDEDLILCFSKIFTQLLQSRRIPTYCDTVWQPFLQKNRPTNIPANKLNLFQGFVLEKVPPSKVDFEKTLMFDLLSRLCNHKEPDFVYLLSFIAHKLQFPADKKPIALCFINSREGVGKGTFGEMLSRIFKCGTNSYVAFNSLAGFANGFNGVKSKALFICLEEVTAKRNCLREYSGFLKDQISSKVILEEIKNKERTIRPWYASIIIYSNDFNVMSCSRTDRRLCMFTSDSSKANDKEYFVKLHKELDNMDYVKAAFDYFSNYDVSDWNYREIPYSEIKDKLAAASERNVTKFHRYLLKECITGQTEYKFNGADIYNHYRDFCDAYGVQKRSNRSYVVNNLELYLKMTKQGEFYLLSDAERRKYLGQIKE